MAQPVAKFLICLKEPLEGSPRPGLASRADWRLRGLFSNKMLVNTDILKTRLIARNLKLCIDDIKPAWTVGLKSVWMSRPQFMIVARTY